MAKYNLTTVRPKGFLHSSAFDEVKSSLAWSLTALGHDVTLTENTFSAGAATNILFGAELLSPASDIPPNSILYNMEQASHPNFATVGRLSRGRVLWDISARNVAHWTSLGLAAIHVPVGYTPNLTRIPKAATQDIDVFFAGWLTPRRRRLIDDLRAAGLNVFASDACYGGARDQILSRSRVCLNVHHDGRTAFELVRVSYLLANSKCVVTETSDDDADYARDFDGAMEWRPYDKLVERCATLARGSRRCVDAMARETLELNGYNAIGRRDFTAIVAATLDSAPAPAVPPPSTLDRIRDRFSLASLEGDMRDFVSWLRGHACGNILEIGTRDGASTSALLLGVIEHGGHLTSIDIDDCSGLWTHPQWTFVRDNSLAVTFPDASFDCVLIDGDHSRSAFIGDLWNAYHWTRPGGLIWCHDIKPERGHEFYAVELREEFHKFVLDGLNPSSLPLKFEILPGKHGMGVIKR